MIHDFIRLLVNAGAVFASGRRIVSCICLVVPVLAVLAFAGSARAQSGYCVLKVSEDELGTRVRIEGGNGCDLYQAVKLHPQSDDQGIDYLRQVQLRRIWAANLELRPDGSFIQPVVKRTCAKPASGPEPGSDAEEIGICGLKATMFYYALPNAVFRIPKGPVLTPAESVAKKAADEAEQKRKDQEAADAALRAREESEASKRVLEMEKKVAEADARAEESEKRLAWVKENEWRAKMLPALFGLLVLVAAWALLSTLGLAGYRFKYRAVTVDGYGYPNPLEAAKDMMMKLAAAREDVSRVKQQAEADRTKSQDIIRKLEAYIENQRTELGARFTLNTSLRKENESLKRSVEAMRVPKPAVAVETTGGIEVLRERCADLDARYNELDEKYKILRREYAELNQAFGELDEAHREIYLVRDRQARRLMEFGADKIALQERIDVLEQEAVELRQEQARYRAVIAEYESNLSSVLRSSSRPPSISVPFPEATSDEAPRKIRVPTVPGMAIAAAPVASNPAVASAEAEPEEVFAGLFQEMAEIKRQLAAYRDGFREIGTRLSWIPAPDSDDLESAKGWIDSVVNQVFNLYPAAENDGPASDAYPAQSEAPMPTATPSDIVRIAKMANLLEARSIDVGVLRRLLTDADALSVSESLKACVHEWSARAEREDMVYAVLEPHELYDLNRFVSARLVCGPDISLMVPEGFSEAVDRVHLAYAPAFSRRAVMRSMPPPAMPQASG